MTIEDIRAIVRDVKHPGYIFEVNDKAGVALLSASYREPDVHTGRMATQKTRKWYVSLHSTKSEIVQTCLKCILTSMEHRAREHFTYRGERIYGPHFDCDSLVYVATEKRKEKE